jgi:hypothetical protein
LTASGAFAENAESAESAKKGGGVLSGLDYEIHGFLETRGGYRTQNDKYEKDMSVMETRMQTDVSGYTDWTDFRVRGDVIGDMVSEQAEFDLREANLSLRPGDNVDLKVGRQILTWGTGDMLFINDLFPKDWQSFFVGRDTEYLKAPSDAVKIGLFGDTANVDFVYTPQFDSDRFISGERVSYWNGNMGSIAGQNAIAHTNKPDRWFRDDEFAVRVYKNVNNYEYALYGYWGYWKSPGGQTGGAGSQMTFPDLNVYGASARGAVGAGIGNVEVGYYESADDSSGKNPLINNSEMRFLVGYSQDVGRDFTAGAQYYVEHMLDYGDYVDNAPAGPLRDRDRSVVTVRLTKLLWNQTLTCSLFTYYSPTDQDAYLRPRVNYKISDDVAVEFGGNVFVGEHKNTFFGQFEDNTNIFAAVRYTF